MMLLAVMDPAQLGHISVGCEGSKEDGIGARLVLNES